MQGIVKNMCTDAQIEGPFTNDILIATGATLLFDTGGPESIVHKRTGHKSLSALVIYESMKPKQKMVVSLSQSTSKESHIGKLLPSMHAYSKQ